MNTTKSSSVILTDSAKTVIHKRQYMSNSSGNYKVYEVIFTPMDGFLNDPMPLPPDCELKVHKIMLYL